MRNIIRLLAVSLTLSQGLAQAAAVNKVFYPIVEPGEVEIELRGFVVQDADPARDGLQVNKADLAYGVTPRWFTELEFVFERLPGQSQELEAIASENVFQLTEQGEYFADFGLFAEYERVIGAKVHEIVLGPIVQKQFDQWLATANLFFEQQFGSEKTETGIEMKSGLQLKYRLSEGFEPGLEYYGYENDQNAGPAAFGLVRMGQNKLKWQAAWLFGLTDVSADNSVRWMLEYEF
jgi:hypothetical protein